MQCRGFEKLKQLRQLENVLLSYQESPSHFGTLDAMIVTALKKMLTNTNFKKEMYVEEQKTQRDNRFFRGRHIAHMTSEYFRFRSTNESIAELSDLMSTTFSGDDVQRLDAKWDGVTSSVREASKDDTLKRTYKTKLPVSEQLKATFALQSRFRTEKLSFLRFRPAGTARHVHSLVSGVAR